jgi:hypothetical protein
MAAFILDSSSNVGIQPYRRESILIKDVIKQTRSKNVSIYPVERNTPDQRLQNITTISINDVHFDLSKQIIEQSNLMCGNLENGTDIFIKKYEQTEVAYSRSTFSMTI